MKRLCSVSRLLSCGLGLVAAVAVSPSADAGLLTNPGFEDADTSGGDVAGAPGWGQFNDAFSSSMSAPAFEGSNVLKIFGPFFEGGGAGVVQNIGAASEGDQFLASAYAQNATIDPIGAGNFAVVKIEFLDAGNAVIGFAESAPINNTLTPDTWTQFSVNGVAPANTASAQLVLVHVQAGEITGGSVFFDAASIELVPEPGSLALLALGGLGMLRRRR